MSTDKTTREEIIEMLENLRDPIRVDDIIRAKKDMRPENIINDINHALKTLKTKGITFKIHPPTCRLCDFTFGGQKLEIKIPTKCPSCKGELINGPTIQKK